jgi:creatinine amidohydrolase
VTLAFGTSKQCRSVKVMKKKGSMHAPAMILTCLAVLPLSVIAQSNGSEHTKAIYLANLKWMDAEKMLTPDAIVVIPMGAESKAHGPHLPLNTDFVQTEYLKKRIAERFNVVIAPTVNYGFYPPFIEFPGSTTVGLSDAKGMIEDICRSLARFGVRRFYVINQGLSTNAALDPAVADLNADGILLRYTDLTKASKLGKDLIKQKKGSHADEVETSIMLHIAPELVDMKKADKDYGQQKGNGIWPTRNVAPKNPLYTIYNPSGTYGDATLATKEKGKIFIEDVLSVISKDIEELRSAEIPAIHPAAERFTKFVGKYEIAPGDYVTVDIDGDSLVAQRTGKPKLVLLSAGPGKFEIGRTELTFLSDSSGKFSLLFCGDGISVLCPKVE